jgi:hypothetical protein
MQAATKLAEEIWATLVLIHDAKREADMASRLLISPQQTRL